jgi:hypothetical protein
MQYFDNNEQPRGMSPNYAEVIVVTAVELERQLASIRHPGQSRCGALELDCELRRVRMIGVASAEDGIPSVDVALRGVACHPDRRRDGMSVRDG